MKTNKTILSNANLTSVDDVKYELNLQEEDIKEWEKLLLAAELEKDEEYISMLKGSIGWASQIIKGLQLMLTVVK